MPTPINIKSSVGEKGLAEVRILKNAIRVVFEESGASYEFEKDVWEEKRPGGKFNVTLTGRNDKILGVRPPSGTYIMKFHSFANRVNDIPEPKIRRGGVRRKKDGGTFYAPDQLTFSVLLGVESKDPKYNGLKVMTILPYVFEQYVNTDIAQLNGRRGDVADVERVMRVMGFDFMRDEIPYSINVLPWLERYFLAKGELLTGTIDENGFAKDLSILPAELRK